MIGQRRSSSAAVGSRSALAAVDQSRESTSTLGSKAPPLSVSPAIAGREQLEELGERLHRPSAARPASG